MDRNYQSIFKGESRKLLWFIGISFVLVLLVQSSELSYGNVLLMILPTSSSPYVRDGVENMESSSMSEILRNMTFSNDGDSGSASPVHGVDSFDYEENDVLPHNETEWQGDTGLNASANSVMVKESVIDLRENESNGGYAPETAMVPDGTVISDHNKSSISDFLSPAPALAPKNLLQTLPPITSLDKNMTNYNVSIVSDTSSMEKEELTPSSGNNGKSSRVEGDLLFSRENSTADSIHIEKSPPPQPSPPPPVPPPPAPAVLTVADMDNLLVQSRSTYRSMKPRWSSKVDQELLDAKLKIENAPVLSIDDGLYAPLYRNASMFKRSYELMEETLKVYIYKEGQKPIFHQPSAVLKGIYASEGWFMKQLKGSKKFVTRDARTAQLFYLPFSSRMLEETLYVPNSHSRRNLVQFLKDYLDLIGTKYPFWNRTGGADHFLVACHDWAPSETKQIMARSIRALCNSDAKEGFVFGKDVSLPETYVRNPQKPLREVGGKPPSKRSILAFFAGNMHGYLRPILLQHWGDNRDPDMKIYGPLPKVKGKMNYVQYMKSSRYCICAKGYEVNSPRVVEAIFFECVPVIISDNFVPPFFEVLNWESFAVFVMEKDIPNLKKILLSIPEKRYREMQRGVKKVQQHFLWHPRPVKYDIFHMILHSVWYNRVLQINPR